MAKLLIKLSGIFAVVFSLINIFVFIGIHFAIPYTVLSDGIYCYYMILIITIISFISLIGGFALIHYYNLSDSELKKKEHCILVWSIFFMVSCPISGILGLIVYFSTFKPISFTHKVGYIEELKELDNLLEEGYITEEEFKLKKKKILGI
jgi:hypothetical protein